MLFPNKLCSYNESIISKFTVVLKVIQREPVTVLALYRQVIGCMAGVNEFLDVLDCLYALHKIEYDIEMEVLKYVA